MENSIQKAKKIVSIKQLKAAKEISNTWCTSPLELLGN